MAALAGTLKKFTVDSEVVFVRLDPFVGFDLQKDNQRSWALNNGHMVEKRREGERNVRCGHDREPGPPASRSV